MKTEYYQSPTELLPTFSLLLAASLTGMNGLDGENGAARFNSHSISTLPSFAHHSYYEPTAIPLESSEQEAALRQFATTLLSKAQDNPQGVVDILNQHFWDLL